MREIRTSSLMSGDGRRTAHAAPRPSSTLPPRMGRVPFLPLVEYPFEHDARSDFDG